MPWHAVRIPHWAQGLDGTLINQQKIMAHLKAYHDFLAHSLSPPPAALHCLRALCADPQNVVYVISGRTSQVIIPATVMAVCPLPIANAPHHFACSQDMESCLGSISGLGLAAENGYLQRPPHATTWSVDECEKRRAGDDLSWRELAQPVLAWYTSRTNGAFVR